MVTVDTPHGAMQLYESRPEGEARGGIVVVQEAFGVNEHIQDVTRRVAAAGYHAVAPEFFHRTADGCIADYGNFESVMKYFGDLSGDDAILNDVDGALDYLRNAGCPDQRLGVVGFCFGGRVSFLAALRRKLGAAVGFYGGGIVTGRFPQFPPLIDEVGALQTPWLGMFGDEDGSIPVEDVEQLREALDKKTKVDAEVVRFADAGHGFHCDMRPDFRPDQARDAWTRTLAWFEKHIG